MHYKFLIQTKQDNPGGNFVEMSNLFVCDFFFLIKKDFYTMPKLSNTWIVHSCKLLPQVSP